MGQEQSFVDFQLGTTVTIRMIGLSRPIIDTFDSYSEYWNLDHQKQNLLSRLFLLMKNEGFVKSLETVATIHMQAATWHVTIV